MQFEITDIDERYEGRLGYSGHPGGRVFSRTSIQNRFELYIDDSGLLDGPDRTLVREQAAYLARLGKPAHKAGYLFFPNLSGCSCTLIRRGEANQVREVVDNSNISGIPRLEVSPAWTYSSPAYYYIQRYGSTYSSDSGVVDGSTTSDDTTSGTLVCIGKSWAVNSWVGAVVTAGSSLDYEAQTGNFTVGLTLTGAISGATGTILKDTDYGATGTLVLGDISGKFQSGETITDSETGSATTDGEACGQSRIVSSNTADTLYVMPGWNAKRPPDYSPFLLEQTLCGGKATAGNSTTLQDSTRGRLATAGAVGDDFVGVVFSGSPPVTANQFRNATILDLETDKQDIKSVVTGNTAAIVFVSPWRKKPDVGDDMLVTFWPDDSLIAEPLGTGYLTNYTFYSEI